MPDRRRSEGLTLAKFLPLPENRSALTAVQQVAAALATGRADRLPSPLLLHGPPGTGKSHLARGLIVELRRRQPGASAVILTAGDFPVTAASDCEAAALLVVEDLQHLSLRAAENLARVLDARQARDLPTVLTALVGPRRLVTLPVRLLERLRGGLVVRLDPPDAAGRLLLLRDKAQRRQLAIGLDVLGWLAERLSGGRQLEAAVDQLEEMGRQQAHAPSLAEVKARFGGPLEEGRPTVERIVGGVAAYYQVDPRQLRSHRRQRGVVLPRQVSMYLARRLTELSLDDIGKYFGGRDHSTVAHACRKIAAALGDDAVLAGAVHQLQGELG